MCRDAVLTPEARAYFVDRYRRLADYYRARGRLAKARRLEAKAAAYSHLPYVPGDDGPPYAAAMAVPRPRRFVTTNAYSHVKLDSPDDAA